MTGAGGHRFLLLYGSQTGQSKAICEEIAERAPDHGLHADLHCLSQTERKFCLEREKLVVIVISTTGDGEVPETAHKFWRRLKKTTLPKTHLKAVDYSLLGLGDTNYTNFCNCGKMVNKRLLELGAKQFYPSMWADDAVGLDVVADPWIEGMFQAIVKYFQSNNSLPASPIRTITNGLAEINSASITSGDVNSDSSKMDTSTDSVDAQRTSSFDDKDSTKLIANGLADSPSGPSGDGQLSSKEISQNLELAKTQTSGGTNSLSSQIVKTTVANESPKPSDTDISAKQSSENAKNNPAPSLCLSIPPLSESALSLPVLPPAYLKISYKADQPFDSSVIPFRNDVPLPSAKTDVSLATLKKATRLTTEEAVKKALLLELNVEASDWTYEPGDSFGIVCPNSEAEVDLLLLRLGVSENSDAAYLINVIEGTKKRNASVPNHIPEMATLRYTLTNCCDIRTPPKKAFVRVLVEYTSEPAQKRRLQELGSKQGAQDYSKFVREDQMSLLDMLRAFPSCQPPVERVLEQLPILQPRAYSACSSLKMTPGAVSFVFNVVEFPEVMIGNRTRRGVCTGWLDDLSMSLQEGHDLEDKVALMKIEDFKIPVYLRGNQYFRVPSNLSVPLIMIGPGTGVAPFIGFLQERAHKIKETSAEDVGETWLLFGCRHKAHDYLFEKELKEFQSSGTLTKLVVSFSRDPQEDSTSPRYVQHNLLKYREEIYKLVEEKNAKIFVCGDAKNMAKDVMSAFVEIMQKYKGLSPKDAEMEVMQLKLKRQYLEDVWA